MTRKMFKKWSLNLITIFICICIFTTVSCAFACDGTNENIFLNDLTANDGANAELEIDDRSTAELEIDDNPTSEKTVYDTTTNSTYEELEPKPKYVPNNGSFDDLDNEIKNLSPGDIYNMDKDYYYKPGDHTSNYGITILVDNITINGNGHIIDGRNQSLLLTVKGKNVKIFNITFMNSLLYKSPTIQGNNYKYQSGRSPIYWEGDNGLISDCLFIGNSALISGGAITWAGNNGKIDRSMFINNTAGMIGGSIYICGSNNIISNCTFINSSSQICGEAIYLDSKVKNCNVSGAYNGKLLLIDGRTNNISVSDLNCIYESVFGGETINLIPLIYSAIMSKDSCVRLNSETTYYVQHVGNKFILTLTKTYSDGLIYEKRYTLQDVENLNDVFLRLIQENYINEFVFTKYVEITCIEDYEYARTLTADHVLTQNQFMIFLSDLSGAKGVSEKSVMKRLNVFFKEGLIINNGNTWNPFESGFDVVNIEGRGATIHIDSGDRDEYKWVSITGDVIFSASNLTIDGFNTAIENLGGICILNFVNLNNNRMDYWIERDWGAGILNAGMCICNNCSFTNNYCKNGGAIFNQRILRLDNCTFAGNKAYGIGNDVLNADQGNVTIDGKEVKGTSGYVSYVQSIDELSSAFITIASVFISTVIGTFVGMASLNPVAGIAVGACIGAAIGALGFATIDSNTFNIHFNRLENCLLLICGCALAGGLGGAIGYNIAQSGILQGGEAIIDIESSTSSTLYPASSGLDTSNLISEAWIDLDDTISVISDVI